MKTQHNHLAALEHNTPFVPSEDALEIRIFKDEHLLDQAHFYEAQTITIGDSPKETFCVQPDDSVHEFNSFALVEPQNERLWIQFPIKASGQLQLEDRIFSLAQIIQSPNTTKDGAFCKFILPAQARFELVLEGFRIELGIISAPKRITAPLMSLSDRHFGRAIGLSVVLHGVLMLFLLFSDESPQHLTDTLLHQKDRFTALIFRPEIPPPAPKVRPSGGPKAGGPKGKAGKQDGPKQKNKMGTIERKKDPNALINTSKLTSDITQKIHKMGLFRGMGQATKGLLELRSLGGADINARGGWTGSRFGDTRGSNGLGLRGFGQGGNGFEGNGGFLNTGRYLSRSTGTHAFGNPKKFVKSKSLIKVTTGTPVTDSAYPKELIRRTIQLYRNQIRYCYERELIKHKKLQGKIKLFFKIEQTGRVSKASIAQSTINNDRVEGCLLRRVMFWKFPAPKTAGVVHVFYPFYFRPAR